MITCDMSFQVVLVAGLLVVSLRSGWLFACVVCVVCGCGCLACVVCGLDVGFGICLIY